MTPEDQKANATGFAAKAKAAVERARARWPVLHHLVHTLMHYSQVQATYSPEP